jgi:hypothetical protein
MAAGYGIGASLASLGTERRSQAMNMLGRVAEDESQRERQNKMLEAEERAQKQQLASTVGSTVGFAAGAQAGSVGGPWGAVIGGAIGLIAGGLF